MKSTLWKATVAAAIIAMLVAACGPAGSTQAPATQAPEATTAPEATMAPGATSAPASEGLTFGLLMVGPYNDRGWSQAHYDAGLYVEDQIPGTKMVYIDKVNPADRPGTTADQLAEQLLGQGATAIIFNSDDMKDAATEFATNHPDIPTIMASGDQAWNEGQNYAGLPNLGNVMPFIEPVKMMAGCAAALTTETGKIGYLGPLINDETRRLASSAYLGAKYCWTNYLGNDISTLEFKVTWIGFWFNIPGVTSDPTQVANDFYNSGFDVVISGIDTTEALTQAKAMTDTGTPVWNVAYDYDKACDEAPDVCLGSAYFNWKPFYRDELQKMLDGDWEPSFQWKGPTYPDINDPDASYAGFTFGDAISADAKSGVERLIGELGSGLNLWTGPINLQDGTTYLADGVEATDQEIWYLPQLLEGMEGQSVPSE
jgi:simple sugar transport system substrate-binding protein